VTNLFGDQDQEHAHARRRDPLTSHLAAERAGVRLTEVQDRVLVLLRIQGPATDDQLVRRFRHYWPDVKVSDQSIRSRRSELVRKGLAEFTGDFGRSEFGQRARIWRAT
jgi:hypothetical protein